MPIITGSGNSGTEMNSDKLGIPTGTSDPESGTTGQIYYNTTTNKIRLYNGSSWVDV